MISDATPDGPIFGRTEQIEDFAGLLRDRAKSSITLLGGDAGIGKTRLVQEIASVCRAARGTVVGGRCLDLGDSAAPYLPITDIARTLSDLPAADGVVSSDVLTPADGVRPVEYFESVATMLDDLSQLAPALVVLEDVHWADRATRELLTYLFTRDVRPGVHVVATYRTDDLHRRHPLRPALAEWSRLPTVRRVVLEPLTSDPARALVEHLRPGLADRDAGEIIRRSGGNPFFTEELVNASMQPSDTGGSSSPLPSDLADLLLVRADSLDEDPRRVLRGVAVAGSIATDSTVRALVDLPAERLHAALRAAIDAHLLVAQRDGTYAFRHALLAEAVYDDLLPGERVRLHDLLTDILLERGECTATLAMHAEQAGRYATALQARIRAGDQALETAAPSNAARHFEKAITLAASHPELTDVPADLSERAAEALLAAGDPHRAAELMRDVLRSFTGPSAERARLLRLYLSALLLTDLPTMHIKLGIADLPDEADELLDIAIGWAGKAEDAVLVGQLVALKAHYLLAFGRYDEATMAAGEAMTIGRVVDDPSITTDAMTTQAKLDGIAGDLSSALATLEKVRVRAVAEGDIRAELRALHQLAGLHARSDHYPTALAIYGDAIRRALEAHARTEMYGMDSVVFAAVLATKLGDWDRVEELLASSDELPPLARRASAAVRMGIDVARGRLARATDAHEKLHQHWPEDMFVLVHDAPAMIEVLGDADDLAGATATYDEATETVRRVWRLPVFDAQIRMSALLLTHLADTVAGDPRAATEWSSRVAQLRTTLESVLSVRGARKSLGTESRAWFARASAELARLSGDDELAVTEYRESVRLFDEAAFPYERACVEVLLSRALHAAGEREEAREVSTRALATARGLGANRLVAQLRSGQARGGDAVRSTALTPRERDVLLLVAEGMTNGQLASRLFISTKTASVHVSNILAKLGASNRTEAVDLARQQGLLD